MLTPIAPPNHWPTRTTSSTSVTLGAGDATVLCDNSSDAVVTTPNAASVPSMMYWVQKIGTNTAMVEVKDHLGNVIVVLYVTGDSALIQSDGTAWRVIGGYLTPHSCKLYRSTDQSIASGAEVRCNFNAAAHDVGNIGDITINGRVQIRRPGKYILQGFWLTENVSTAATQCFIRLNGAANVAISPLLAMTTTYHRPLAVTTVDLSAGDYIDLILVHFIGSNHNSGYGIEQGPWLAVTEQR